MRDAKLGNLQRAALFTLMVEARELPNPELKERFGLSLTGDDSRKLNERGLVATTKRLRNSRHCNFHVLTDKGWAWCADELSAEVPVNPGSLGRALYALLPALKRYLDDTGMRLDDVFQPGKAEAPEEIVLDRRVRAAYWQLASGPRAWVGLTALREQLDGASRAEIDEALHRLSRADDVNIIPESNQKTLTPADRDAAIRIGGEDRHLIAMGDR